MSVMKRVVRGLPRLRNAMLLGLAGQAARIPDDTPEVSITKGGSESGMNAVSAQYISTISVC